MKTVQIFAFNRALRTLNALGAKYKIVLPNGASFEGLKTMETEQRTGKFAHTGYVDAVRAMEIGSVLVFETPEGGRPESFRSAISGVASFAFGRNACTTHLSGRTVEILREA